MLRRKRERVKQYKSEWASSSKEGSCVSVTCSEALPVYQDISSSTASRGAVLKRFKKNPTMTHFTTFIHLLVSDAFPHLFPILHFACYSTPAVCSAILQKSFQKEALQLLTMINKVSPPNS